MPSGRYAERKLGKLDKQVRKLARVELELAVEKNPSIAENQVAEATVWLKGHTLRAREATRDMKVSIDELTEKLVRQVQGRARAQGVASGRSTSTRWTPTTPRRPTLGPLPAREPLHERLAREGGLVERPQPGAAPPWREAGVHGMQRPREWDATLTVEAPGIEGDAATLRRASRRLAARRGGLGLVAAAARRRGRAAAPAAVPRRAPRGSAATCGRCRRARIEVLALPDAPDGDAIELTQTTADDELSVDGEPHLRLDAGARGARRAAKGADYVVQAERLDGDLWEVRASPL